MIMKILTSKLDDPLYDRFMVLLYQIKLVQGGTSLASTLRRHSNIKSYLFTKQISILGHLEETYFLPDGTLDREALESLQK